MGFILFSNKEIVRDFLRNDGVHLNEAETEVLGGGFVDHINDFILYNGFRYNMIIYSKENNPLSTPSKLKNDWFSKKIKKVCTHISKQPYNRLFKYNFVEKWNHQSSWNNL